VEANFLLIISRHGLPWLQVFKEALSPFGTLQFGREENAVALVMQQSYDLIIMDVTAVKDAPLLISCMRTQRPDARVIVIAGSPTWKQAREVFHAGATDYIRKSLNKGELVGILQVALAKAPPQISGT
jgi:DNA-binding NtrC family response regulator